MAELFNNLQGGLSKHLVRVEIQEAGIGNSVAEYAKVEFVVIASAEAQNQLNNIWEHLDFSAKKVRDSTKKQQKKKKKYIYMT